MLKTLWCLLTHKRHWHKTEERFFTALYECDKCGERHMDRNDVLVRG